MKNLLRHHLASDLDLDSQKATETHERIIREKAFLQKIYSEWGMKIASLMPNNPKGIVLEIGSGGGCLKTFIPEVITSEILPHKNVHLRIDARFLPFSEKTIKAIVMTDVFHHIPDVRKFLHECARCVQPGGRIIMIEPWLTKWSAFIYTKLHHEPCLPDTPNWSFRDTGPLSAANLALPWIVFKRDQETFITEFPELEVNLIQPDWPIAYLLSGGVSMKSFAPGFSYSFLRSLESLFRPVMDYIAMFAIIVLERKQNVILEQPMIHNINAV